MEKKKLKIGITGNIGSGKSTFAEFIKQKGFTVINADDISKTILATNENVKRRVVQKFGEESFSNGLINREYLSDKVFSNPENVLIINSILHPLVLEKIDEIMNEELKTNDKIFVEAALIYEADMEDMFDYVILIAANTENRFKRKSTKLNEKDFELRDSNQIPELEKKKRADFIFENNGSLQELKTKADLLLTIL
jgi:dephospho-CoA kinase